MRKAKSMKSKLNKYFNNTIGILPEYLTSLDTSSIGGIAILKKLHLVEAKPIIDFIYAHQIQPSKEWGTARCGFRGSTFIGASLDVSKQMAAPPLLYDACHVTMNYAALNTLLMLGDDLERVNKEALMDGMVALENYCDHLINASIFCPEFDARFVFSAIASAYILDRLDRLNVDAFTELLSNSITYEGGFGQLPGLEAHAGATYCSVASLKLMGKLDTLLPPESKQRSKLISWLLRRQVRGFNGRCGKDEDTCYTFWVGACLKMLNVTQYVDRTSLLEYICTAYNPIVGGFMKCPIMSYTDPLHSFMTLSGMSAVFLDSPKMSTVKELTADFIKLKPTDEGVSVEEFEYLCHLVCGEELDQESSLESIVPELNLPMSAFEHLKRLHAKWNE